MARAPEQAVVPGGDSHAPRIRELLAEDHGSALTRYRQVVYPTGSLLRFCLFELATMILLPMPGGLGLWLRRKLLRPFFGSLGRNAVIGRNCTFRHPQRIFIGDGVVIDDNCVIDARGAGESGVRLGDYALISRGVQIKSKSGPIHVGANVTLGDGTVVVSHSGIQFGDGAAVATGCQIIAGTFQLGEFARPAGERNSFSAGPITIGAGAWLATGVIVLDAASVGENAVVSAGSVVTRAIPARCVAQGNPARKVFDIR